MNKKIEVGLRLFCIALGLLTANYLPVLIAFLAPMPSSWGLSLGIAGGDDDDDEDDDDEPNKATKVLLKKIRVDVKKEFANHVKAYDTEAQAKISQLIDQRLLGFKDLPVDKIKALIDGEKAINDAIAEMKGKFKNLGERKGKKDYLALKVKEMYPEIKKYFDANPSGNYSFKLDSVKAPDLVNLASFADRVLIGYREPGVAFEPLPEIFIFDLIRTLNGGPGSNPLSWVERQSYTQAGPPAIVANPTPVLESAVKPQLGYKWVENKIMAETIAAIVPVTKQAIYSYPQLEEEIKFELRRRLLYVLQEQIIKGTGVSPQLKGINTYAEAFAAGSFAAAVEAANIYDVLVAAATQVLQNGFVPSAALVSYQELGKINMMKDNNGSYVLPPFMTGNGATIYGMRIIGSNAIPDDTFLVGDFTKSLFNWVEPVTIEIGWINDDFAKNQYRIRGELQGMHRIKAHEQGAFVKGTFSSAITAIDKPGI